MPHNVATSEKYSNLDQTTMYYSLAYCRTPFVNQSNEATSVFVHLDLSSWIWAYDIQLQCRWSSCVHVRALITSYDGLDWQYTVLWIYKCWPKLFKVKFFTQYFHEISFKRQRLQIKIILWHLWQSSLFIGLMKNPIRSYGSIRSVLNWLLIRHPKHTQPHLYNYPAWSPRQNIQGIQNIHAVQHVKLQHVPLDSPTVFVGVPHPPLLEIGVEKADWRFHKRILKQNSTENVIYNNIRAERAKIRRL